MNTLSNLNIKFTLTEADNDSIYAASNSFQSEAYSEIAERFNCDLESAEQIKTYLVDQGAISEGINVQVWFS